MKKLVIAMVLICAGAAIAGPIYDLQTGGYALDAEVVVDGAIVTGVRYNGVYISEDVAGPYTGVWVYTGSDPGVSTGDLVDVKGLYKEYYDLTEIDVAVDPTGYLNYVGPFEGTLVPAAITTATFSANPEAYEGCFISLLGLMTVTNPDMGYGEWEAVDMTDGEYMIFDDYWYDPAGISLGDCFCCAVGVIHYGFGAYKLEPFEGSICFMPCPVANEGMSFGQVKALYR